MSKIKKASKKSLIVGLIILLVLAVLGGFYYSKHRNNNAAPSTTTTQDDKLDLSPATEEDKQRADQNKEDIIKRDQDLQNQPPTSGKKTVKPIITYAGIYGPQAEVGANVPGVFEDSGACVATFTNGSTSFSKSVIAVKNVSSNSCPVMAAKNEEFSSKGIWSVVVTYSSTTSTGASDTKSFEVK